METEFGHFPVHVPDEFFYADTVYDRIEGLINAAVAGLKEGERLQVEVPLTDRTIVANGFGYQNPNFIIVYGADDEGETTALVSHTAIHVIVRKRTAEKPTEKRTIGFRGPAKILPQGIESGEAVGTPTVTQVESPRKE